MTGTKMFLFGAISLIAVTTSSADKQNAWNLKFSDPNRGGKFLNIPIHYGDWVPITAAKALVEEVANRQRQQNVPRERVDKRPADPVKEDTPELEADRRADHGGVHYVDTKNRGYQTNFRHHQQQQQRHHVQHHNTNTRRQDAKSIRFSSQNHLNADASRRNTKKLPPPPPTHFNQIGNNVRTKPVAPPQPQQQSAFPFGFNSFSSFNPFSFFDTGRPSVTTPAPRAPGAAPVTQDKSVNVNAIRTIAAPDLSKYGPGPPVIELDSGKDGEIILGRPYHVGDGQRDHLAGFVSVDFDGFTPGDREDKKAKLKKKQKQQEKEKLAIIVGGKSNAKPRDESDLVNFLNNDRENTETFVFSSDKNPPQGFAKIDLPFMDPTKHHGHLPKAFIAPKGIPIPDGYKGKPLPTQPAVAAVPVTTEKVLVHSTQDSHNLFRARPSRFQPVSAVTQVTQATPVPASTEKPVSLFTSSLLRSKTRNRPSLDDLFRKNIQKAALLDEKNKNSRERIESYDRTYKINNKVEDARKEFQKESTLSPVIIPVENNFNTFKLVTDNNHEEVAESHNDVIDLDHVISAGEADNDPISLVFEPEEVLIQSTFEQDKQKDEVESTSAETSTSFAPTVVPTTFAETTTPTAVETTTEEATSSTTTTSTTTTTTTFSSTTTTTTTTSTTTTTFEATERAVKYTTQDPFARLESWKKKKFQFGSKAKYPLVPSYQGDLLTAEDIDETDSAQQPSTEATYNFAQHFRNRQRPWGKNGGRRLRRKKPSRGVYVKKHTSDTLGLFGGIEPTRRPYKPRTRVNSYTTSTKSTTETTEAVDQAQKKKYRPFFDEIYSRLTTEKAETTEKDTSRRYGLPRLRGSRSTTAAPLFTADLLEVYEVDPETGLRVTTRSPTTKSQDLHFSRTTTQLKSIEPVDTDTDYYTYQDDYVYEPTTSQAPVTKEETEVTTEEVREYVPTVQTSVKTVTENVATEEPSTVAVEVTEEEIHETADKHSTTTLPSVETTFSYDDNAVDVDRIDLDIHNEISDQVVEESQRIETTWNGVVKVEDHTQANTRLSSYEKNVDTSIYGADTEYNVSGLVPQVNEHSKPTATGAEHHEDGDNQSGDSWQTSVTQPKVREYLEIDRSEPIARVEEVPITESRDYSEPDIIYDVTKDGFDDDVDTFSVPVAVAFNVPETETPVVIQTTTVSQEVTTSDIIETETSTAPVIETTTLREAVPTTTAEEVQSSTTTTTAEEQSTTTFAEEATTTASPTTEKPESTFNKFYNLIHRNRNNRLEQVYLGSRPTTTVRTTTTTVPTTQIIDLTKSAHKVPNSVWSHFERSREDRTTTRAPVVVVEEEENTTTMSYNNTNNNSHVVGDLPKPSDHESSVLVEKQVVNTDEAVYSGFVPRRKTNKEKWRKSLLASKKKYNKPKFPRVPLLPFAPSHQKSQYHPETTAQTVTTKEDEDKNEIVDEVAREPTLFAPTMPPKEENKEESNNRPLLDNIYSSTSRRKVNTSLFQKPEVSSTTESKTSKTPRVFGVPRGSRTDLFRSYGTSSLSQADFERQILGVSTATEISVKSMICVKGRCYNADESGRLKQN